MRAAVSGHRLANLGRIAALIALALLEMSCAGRTVPPSIPSPAIQEHFAALALVGGTLIDGTGADPVRDAVVLVVGNRIAAVGSRSAIAVPEGAEVLDVTGATILPGFINAHVHDAYDAERLATWARAGVTTVRDEGVLSGRSLDACLAQRDEWAGDPARARLVSAGYMLCPPDGYGQREVSTAEDAHREVAAALDAGVDLIKFSAEDGYAQWSGLPVFEQHVMNAIVETAHGRGALVTVHVCDARYLPAVLDAGVDDIAHIQYDRVSDSVIQRLVDEDVAVVPTLAVLEAYGALGGAQANLRRFVEAGVTIAMGNDYTAIPQNGFDHFELGMPMHELRRMAEAGMTPMQVIVAATRNGARVCGLESELGTLEPGKTADILVVQGDPLVNLEALLNVRAVIHDGVMIVVDSGTDSKQSEVRPMGLFARLSGLRRLAERYGVSDVPEGDHWTHRTVQLGPVRYRRCVDVTIGPAGLFLWVRPPMGTQAKLLVPWREIAVSGPARLYWLAAERLAIGQPELGSLTVYRDLYDAMAPYLDTRM